MLNHRAHRHRRLHGSLITFIIAAYLNREMRSSAVSPGSRDRRLKIDLRRRTHDDRRRSCGGSFNSAPLRGRSQSTRDKRRTDDQWAFVSPHDDIGFGRPLTAE